MVRSCIGGRVLRSPFVEKAMLLAVALLGLCGDSYAQAGQSPPHPQKDCVALWESPLHV